MQVMCSTAVPAFIGCTPCASVIVASPMYSDGQSELQLGSLVIALVLVGYVAVLGYPSVAPASGIGAMIAIPVGLAAVPILVMVSKLLLSLRYL